MWCPFLHRLHPLRSRSRRLPKRVKNRVNPLAHNLRLFPPRCRHPCLLQPRSLFQPRRVRSPMNSPPLPKQRHPRFLRRLPLRRPHQPHFRLQCRPLRPRLNQPRLQPPHRHLRLRPRLNQSKSQHLRQHRPQRRNRNRPQLMNPSRNPKSNRLQRPQQRAASTFPSQRQSTLRAARAALILTSQKTPETGAGHGWKTSLNSIEPSKGARPFLNVGWTCPEFSRRNPPIPCS